jgi:hypothetical protein
MKYYLFLLSLILLGLGSCKKDEDSEIPQNPIETFDDGTIILGQDNCGYLLSRPKETLKPVNLDTLFKVNGLLVKGKFRRKSSNAICGLKNSVFQNIGLLEINNR